MGSICPERRIERSGFEPWPSSLCSVLRQDNLFSQCLSPPRCINGYQRMDYHPTKRWWWGGEGGGGRSRSTSDTSCCSVLAMQPGHGVLMTFHNAATFYAVDGKISYMLVHNILSPHSTQ